MFAAGFIVGDQLNFSLRLNRLTVFCLFTEPAFSVQ
jgi:hypothetical protein